MPTKKDLNTKLLLKIELLLILVTFALTAGQSLGDEHPAEACTKGASIMLLLIPFMFFAIGGGMVVFLSGGFEPVGYLGIGIAAIIISPSILEAAFMIKVDALFYAIDAALTTNLIAAALAWEASDEIADTTGGTKGARAFWVIVLIMTSLSTMILYGVPLLL